MCPHCFSVVFGVALAFGTLLMSKTGGAAAPAPPVHIILRNPYRSPSPNVETHLKTNPLYSLP